MFKILGRQLELTNDKVIEKLDILIEEWLNKVNSISLSGCKNKIKKQEKTGDSYQSQ